MRIAYAECCIVFSLLRCIFFLSSARCCRAADDVLAIVVVKVDLNLVLQSRAQLGRGTFSDTVGPPVCVMS